ncbi:DUF2656 domain-containing protein [Pleurocapsales cyanobacterium LEGE 10410]|nr:DUF2656 domain-containing protein [Pleurocapsales cyanobacterium LEGE 10410]
MLLSHNFNLRKNELPGLNREEFAQVFIDGLQKRENIKCSYIQNPHWVVEIVFPLDEFEPKEIGQMCGDILLSKRQTQQADSKLITKLITDTLILGGRKTTPATSMSPTSLQFGEWGVDVVETPQAEVFLKEIAWDKMIADKPSDGIFKIEYFGMKD